MIYLRKPKTLDVSLIRKAYEVSRELHEPWSYAPENYREYLSAPYRYFLCKDNDQTLVGTFHISAVLRGHFQSAFLGYDAFVPHAGKGYMKKGIQMLLKKAFGELNLHRLEANIQPGNEPSRRLVQSAGFEKEGYSKNYLRIGGIEWRDHERWAILNPDWRENWSAPV